MAFENAQRFVAKMKEDKDFRLKVQRFADCGSMPAYLESSELSFDLLDLVRAMAGCMEELDQMMLQMKQH
jgi:hypothetical protein